MEIAKVAEQAAVTAQTAPKTSVQTSTEKAKSTLTADNADKYVKSEDTFTPAYTKKSAQKKEVDNADRSQFRTVAQSKADHLASVVETIISHQASSKTNKNAKQIELSDALKSQIEEATGQQVRRFSQGRFYQGLRSCRKGLRRQGQITLCMLRNIRQGN